MRKKILFLFFDKTQELSFHELNQHWQAWGIATLPQQHSLQQTTYNERSDKEILAGPITALMSGNHGVHGINNSAKS
jgi:hypothetical protein